MKKEKRQEIYYQVLIKRGDAYFEKRFIETSILEWKKTEEEILSYASGKDDKVFKLTHIYERIK